MSSKSQTIGAQDPSHVPQTSPIDNRAATGVVEAIETRRSVRAFTSEVIPEAELREMLAIAARAASGGNVQPWKVYVLGPAKRDELVARVQRRMAVDGLMGEPAEYDIYPQGMEKEASPLNKPYMGRRRQLAYQMYNLMGVNKREDRAGRAAAMMRNFTFFDAPVGLMFTIEAGMGPPQWADVGQMMAHLMLLARARGWHTCPQEAWANWHESVKSVVGIPTGEVLFSGLAIGKADLAYEANTLRATRAPMAEWASFQGYSGGGGAAAAAAAAVAAAAAAASSKL